MDDHSRGVRYLNRSIVTATGQSSIYCIPAERKYRTLFNEGESLFIHQFNYLAPKGFHRLRLAKLEDVDCSVPITSGNFIRRNPIHAGNITLTRTIRKLVQCPYTEHVRKDHLPYHNNKTMCCYLLLKVSNSVSNRWSLQMTHPNVTSGEQPAIFVRIVLGDVIRYFSIVGIL